MKLLTKKIISAFEAHPFGSQDGLGEDARVLVKYFGGGAYTFLVTEAERLPDGDWHLYGKATFGFGWEWGDALLSQIAELRFPPFGLPVERDLYLSPYAKVSEVAK